MPKAKKRRKTTKRSVAGNVAVREQATRPVSASVAERPSFFSASGTGQNILFSAMMALGFWGFAIYCIFFFTVEPNHYLYGAVMALTAVIWSILAVRRWSSLRQRA